MKSINFIQITALPGAGVRSLVSNIIEFYKNRDISAVVLNQNRLSYRSYLKSEIKKSPKNTVFISWDIESPEEAKKICTVVTAHKLKGLSIYLRADPDICLERLLKVRQHNSDDQNRVKQWFTFEQQEQIRKTSMIFAFMMRLNMELDGNMEYSEKTFHPFPDKLAILESA